MILCFKEPNKFVELTIKFQFAFINNKKKLNFKFKIKLLKENKVDFLFIKIKKSLYIWSRLNIEFNLKFSKLKSLLIKFFKYILSKFFFIYIDLIWVLTTKELTGNVLIL